MFIKAKLFTLVLIRAVITTFSIGAIIVYLLALAPISIVNKF